MFDSPSKESFSRRPPLLLLLFSCSVCSFPHRARGTTSSRGFSNYYSILNFGKLRSLARVECRMSQGRANGQWPERRAQLYAIGYRQGSRWQLQVRQASPFIIKKKTRPLKKPYLLSKTKDRCALRERAALFFRLCDLKFGCLIHHYLSRVILLF